MVLLAFLLNSSAAQENIKQTTNWATVREAFEAYCKSPSADNANKILAALPNNFSNREDDFDQWVSAVNYVYKGQPFRVMDELVRKGDRLALRVACKTLFMSDGAFGEALCGLIGRAVRVNPRLFLEEIKISGQDRDMLGSILVGDIDADEYRPEVVNKEVQLRIKSLKTVNRPDLLELRDVCIIILKESLKDRGGAYRGIQERDERKGFETYRGRVPKGRARGRIGRSRGDQIEWL